jgi:hypothetical protein
VGDTLSLQYIYDAFSSVITSPTTSSSKPRTFSSSLSSLFLFLLFFVFCFFLYIIPYSPTPDKVSLHCDALTPIEEGPENSQGQYRRTQTRTRTRTRIETKQNANDQTHPCGLRGYRPRRCFGSFDPAHDHGSHQNQHNHLHCHDDCERYQSLQYLASGLTRTAVRPPLCHGRVRREPVAVGDAAVPEPVADFLVEGTDMRPPGLVEGLGGRLGQPGGLLRPVSTLPADCNRRQPHLGRVSSLGQYCSSLLDGIRRQCQLSDWVHTLQLGVIGWCEGRISRVYVGACLQWLRPISESAWLESYCGS